MSKRQHKPEPRQVKLKADGGKLRQDARAVVMRETFMHLAQAKAGAEYLESPKMVAGIVAAGKVLIAMGGRES